MNIRCVVHLIFEQIAVEQNFSRTVYEMGCVGSATYDSPARRSESAAHNAHRVRILSEHANPARRVDCQIFERDIRRFVYNERGITTKNGLKYDDVSDNSRKARMF